MDFKSELATPVSGSSKASDIADEKDHKVLGWRLYKDLMQNFGQDPGVLQFMNNLVQHTKGTLDAREKFKSFVKTCDKLNDNDLRDYLVDTMKASNFDMTLVSSNWLLTSVIHESSITTAPVVAPVRKRTRLSTEERFLLPPGPAQTVIDSYRKESRRARVTASEKTRLSEQVVKAGPEQNQQHRMKEHMLEIHQGGTSSGSHAKKTKGPAA